MDSDLPEEVMDPNQFNGADAGKTPQELQQEKENNADDVQF